jgi:hypothetical protein
MSFLNQGGNNVTISLDNPKEDLTAAEVQTAMDLIIARNIFTSSGGDLISKAYARVIDTTTTELFSA